ncbi:MAG: tRNA threonylcarbamoyladenosine dehydratase [Zetaproteobacteria bacterium]|nr:tRNA threonylcarbamoyladenosine dehydratase [Zetaproteobacteria bacterium]
MSQIQERTEILLGQDGLDFLQSKHLLVVGVGGVGGAVTEAIARAGIGHITLIDHDRVGLSNINRQLVATHATLGMDKVAAMGERLMLINPALNLTLRCEFVNRDHLDALLQAGGFDYVIDCIDSVSCKAELVAACQRFAIPVASSLGAGGRLDVSKVEMTTLEKTYNCGLATNLRRKLRALGMSLDYPVVFSGEYPIKPLPQQPVCDDPNVLPRAVNGTISYMPNLFGFMLAGHVVRTLLMQSGRIKS